MADNDALRYLPVWINSFKLLTTLNMPNCSLAEFPTEICQLPKLTTLIADGNQFASVPAALVRALPFHLPALQGVNLLPAPLLNSGRLCLCCLIFLILILLIRER